MAHNRLSITWEFERLFSDVEFPAHTMTIDAVVDDLAMCISREVFKRKKRTLRLNYILDHYWSMLSRGVIQNATNVLKDTADPEESWEFEMVEKCVPDNKLVEIFENLKFDLVGGPDSFEVDPNSNKPVDPVDVLNNIATKILNYNGYVHKITTHVALVALHRLKQNHRNAPVTGPMVAGAKLILKGGVAAGKYHLKGCAGAFRLFIQGGDNDMCLKFPLMEALDDETANDCKKRNSSLQRVILSEYIHTISQVLEEFDVFEELEEHINLLSGVSTVAHGKRCLITHSVRRSFKVVKDTTKDGDNWRKIEYLEGKKSALYSTMSTLKFFARDKQVCHFHLARIKLALEATLVDEDTMVPTGNSIPCFSEFMDVAVLTPFNTARDCDITGVSMRALMTY